VNLYKPSKLSTIILFVFALSIVSCSKKNNSSKTNDGILKIGNGSEPSSLDPHVATGVPEHNILLALFEGLITPDPKTLKPTPGMAQSWTVSKNLSVYTFKIRDDAKWSNEDPVTAFDFEYSWKRILTPALASEYSYMLYPIKNAEAYHKGKITSFDMVGAKALDAKTFKVILKGPTPYFLKMLAHYSTWPVHKPTIEKYGQFDDRANPWTRVGRMVNNGPFVLKEWSINKVLSVIPNPKYWNKNSVKLLGINFYPIDQGQTEERLFRSGKLHITSTVPNHKIKTYQDKKPDLIKIDPYLGNYFYRFNVNKKPFNDVRVRRALTLSIDRKSIIDNILKGGQLPALSIVPPNLSGYQSPKSFTENVMEAKKLLSEAGYPDGKNFPVTEILYNTNDSHKAVAVAIQQMWKKNLGINITLNNQEWKVYLDTTSRLDYQLSRGGWIGDYPDPNTFLDMWTSNSGINNTGWGNKKYDSLIAKAAVSSSASSRLKILQQAEAILIEELPILPIYFYTRIYLKAPTLKGWEPNILDNHPYQNVSLRNIKVKGSETTTN